MHPNPIFHKTQTEAALRFVRERAFGVLAVSTAQAPLLSHIPFLLAPDGHSADLHLVRSNPICRAVGQGVAVRLDVLGPDGYVSPDWYGIDDQVPTWNYVAVHLTGTLRALPTEQLDDVLARQSAAYEARLPKAPWTMDKLSDDVHARFVRMILPFRLDISEIKSTYKLGQNKDDAVRQAAARDLAQSPIGASTDALAALMQDPPDLSK